MRIRNLFFVSVCFVVFFSFLLCKDCQAISVSEQYSSCFEGGSSENLNIQKTKEEDLETLRSIIFSNGSDFTRYLGYGTKISNVADELLTLDDEALSLTIRNLENNIIGQIIVSSHSDINQLSITYWIGKDFCGRGYASLAVHEVMSKIWEFDNTASFEFCIDDENIASIKVLEKVCRKLGLDFINPDSCNSYSLIKDGPHTFEKLLRRNIDDPLIYEIQSYQDEILIENLKLTSEKLAKIKEDYSEDKIESGVLCKSKSTIYTIKQKIR